MDRHQHDGAKVKAEDDELGIWVPVNQEPAESVPAVVPKDDPINREIYAATAPWRNWSEKNKKEEIPLSAHQHGVAFEKMSKKQRRDRHVRHLEQLTALLCDELAQSRVETEEPARTLRMQRLEQANITLRLERDEARKDIAQMTSTFQSCNSRLKNDVHEAHKTNTAIIYQLRASEQKLQALNQQKQATSIREEPQATAKPKRTNTTASLQAEIYELEEKLRFAHRKTEIAERDTRALKKDQIDAEALEQRLADERMKNKAMGIELQKALEKEKDKSGPAQSGSSAVNEREVGMTGLQGRGGRRTRKRVRIEAGDEDEYMDSE